ncbi:MAG: hypothetical protein ACEQSK_06890 [Sphingomonadaceae bacterium]
MKTVSSLSLSLVDFIKADAGVSEAQFDARVAALDSAYFHILKSGNKTQWNLVESQLALYTTAKSCGVLVGTPDRTTPKAKRAFEVFGAYKQALLAVGIPEVMKAPAGITKAQRDAWYADHAAPVAQSLAMEFATMVTVTLTPEAKIVPSDEEKAATKAAKELAKQEAAQAAEAEFNATVQAEAAKLAESLAGAVQVSMADMVRMVAAAARSGALDTEALAMLDSALDSRAVVTYEMPADGIEVTEVEEINVA